MKILFLFLIMTTSLDSFAGSAQARLNCVSTSGKTKIKAIVPGDSDESLIKISINNETKVIYNDLFKETFDLNNDRATIEEEYPNGFLSEIIVVNAVEKSTFTLAMPKQEIQIYSHGQTLTYSNNVHYGYKSTFKATIHGSIDNLFPNQKLPYSIDLNCSLEYSL